MRYARHGSLPASRARVSKNRNELVRGFSSFFAQELFSIFRSRDPKTLFRPRMVERGFSLYTKEQCQSQRPIHSWRRAWRARATPSMEASGAKVIRAPRRGCGWRRHGLRGKKVLQIVSYGRLFSRPARFLWTPGGHACRPARCPSRCLLDISMTGLQANSTAATGRSGHPAAARMRATRVPL